MQNSVNGVVEIVAYQTRFREAHPQTVNYGEWSEWRNCSKQQYEDLLKYIEEGYSYEVRLLMVIPGSVKSADPAVARHKFKD